ncbi:MAG: ABC transporter permease, partial [Sphaerochaetaceae bacterium]
MKAWKYIADLTEKAIPTVLGEDEQTWLAATDVELQSDAYLRLMWQSHVPGSGAPECITVAAIQSWEQLGYDVTEAESYLKEGFRAFANEDMGLLQTITARIYKSLFSSPKDKDSPYWRHTVYETYAQYRVPDCLHSREESIGVIICFIPAWLDKKWGSNVLVSSLMLNFIFFYLAKYFANTTFKNPKCGFVAGVGGAVEVLGMYDRFQWQKLPGYGFDGIVVAILAKNKPQFVPLAAFFLAYL